MRRSFLVVAAFLIAGASTFAQRFRDPPPRIKVDVDLVVVRVTVTDPLNRYVVGLEPDHFRLFENKVEQEIIHFSNSISPVSVGIILDISGSMTDNILSARNSIVRFLEHGDDRDEYFLITFNDRTVIAHDFTSKSDNIQNEVTFANPKGRTALFDAIYLGLDKIRGGRNEKKALIVITDGEDNRSRYTFSEVKEFAKESDVQIYVIGERGKLDYGRAIISQITRLTGGRAFFPSNFKQLDYFVDLIHTELRNQYVLGFASSDPKKNGEWRRLKIRLDPPEGLPRLSVRAREGYFAPNRN